MTGARAIDHLVLPTRNLGALAAAFSDLGFQVGPRNRHPWGTENHIVQVPGSFLELIGLADDFRSVAIDDPAYPFAGFVEEFLRTRADGIGMLVLRSANAQDDAAAFIERQIGHGAMLPFSRSSQAPDGTERVVAFTIAFAASPSMPSIGFFVCEQHRPENFWSSARQFHPNGASALTGIVIAAQRPEDHVHFLSAFGDPVKIETIDGGLRLNQESGTIDVITPQALETRHGCPIDLGGQEARIAAVVIEVDDAAAPTNANVPSGSQAGGPRLVRVAGGEINLLLSSRPATQRI